MQSGHIDRIHPMGETELVLGVSSKSLLLRVFRVFRVLRVLRGNSHRRFQVKIRISSFLPCAGPLFFPQQWAVCSQPQDRSSIASRLTL